jgi:hypothetical protein
VIDVLSGTSQTPPLAQDEVMSPNPRTRTNSKTTAARKTPPAPDSAERVPTEEHEGATDDQVGDTTGPGVGYDQEPVQEGDKGGVS